MVSAAVTISLCSQQLLTRSHCCHEIRMALKYRKNVTLVYETDERHGGVARPFVDFYMPELQKAFPNPDDYHWLMRNCYVKFHDRGQHVEAALNGILDQMQCSDTVLCIGRALRASPSVLQGVCDWSHWVHRTGRNRAAESCARCFCGAFHVSSTSPSPRARSRWAEAMCFLGSSGPSPSQWPMMLRSRRTLTSLP